jgi:hypothetical protein
MKNEMGGACGTYGDRRGAYRVLVKKLKEKRPLGRPRCRSEENIKTDLKEMGWGRGGAWSGLMWLRIRTSGRVLLIW